MNKIIITAEPDNFIVAIRAAKWLLERPRQREAFTAYEDGAELTVRRRKASITVKQLTSTHGENR